MHGTRVNWVGMTGAVVLFGYGWWREPLAAVLGGMILLADLLAMEVSVRKRDGKNAKNTLRIQCFEKNVKKKKNISVFLNLFSETESLNR